MKTGLQYVSCFPELEKNFSFEAQKAPINLDSANANSPKWQGEKLRARLFGYILAQEYTEQT